MSAVVLSGFGEARSQNSLRVGDNAATQGSSVLQMNQECNEASQHVHSLVVGDNPANSGPQRQSCVWLYLYLVILTLTFFP